MSTRRSRRQSILAADTPAVREAPPKLIQFGSPGRAAGHCTYADAPADFLLCFDCSYNRGAKGTGILCGHRFGIDPTLVGGRTTQFRDGEIIDVPVD